MLALIKGEKTNKDCIIKLLHEILILIIEFVIEIHNFYPL